MKFFLILFLCISFLQAKKDFYYGFINSSGNQISQKKKQQISDGFDIIENARQLSKEGKINDAFSLIENFKAKNKINVLSSDILVLYAELALKKNTKRATINATKELEKAINSSLINEYDLAKAYSLLVDLKLETNKVEDAKYFANIIINNFDDEFTKTQGKVALAKVYKYQKNYSSAIKTLYEILTKTKDKQIATFVANELFNVYLLAGKKEEASSLIGKVLKNNIDFFANDSYLANEKINKLIKAGMPEHASEILEELLQRSTKDESIEDFKYKLANTYMMMYDKTNFYLEKAKELYKDLINDYPNGYNSKRARMYLDEILMRQGFIKPSVIAEKYKTSEAMQQKALLQELINNKIDKKYESIFKNKRVYKNISNTIAKRFAYDTLNDLFDEINLDLIKEYLSQGKCSLVNDALKNSSKQTLLKLIEDETSKYNFFQCLIESPNKKAYLQLRENLKKTRDSNVYLSLEKIALNLNLLDEAIDFSNKVEMVDDENTLKKEFLYRYQIAKRKNNGIYLDKFMIYASLNPEYVDFNKNNPIIIDFYHDNYLFLLKNEKFSQAREILNKLYKKQNELKVYIYSPYIEMELANNAKDKNKNQEALEYLLEGLENARVIKPNEKVKLFYEILKTYEILGNKIKQDEYIKKCKDVKNTKDSFYKKMCDGM